MGDGVVITHGTDTLGRDSFIFWISCPIQKSQKVQRLKKMSTLSDSRYQLRSSMLPVQIVKIHIGSAGVSDYIEQCWGLMILGVMV